MTADADRFEQVLQELGPSLRRLAACYEPVTARQEELYQEISLAIWQALSRFRGDSSMRTFVYRIAHNRALTHVWRRKAVDADVAEAEQIADPAPSPEASTSRRQQREHLARALRTLPIVHRQVLSLALEDLSNREIASVVGVSEKAVAVRLTRARQALRAALGVSS